MKSIFSFPYLPTSSSTVLFTNILSKCLLTLLLIFFASTNAQETSNPDIQFLGGAQIVTAQNSDENTHSDILLAGQAKLIDSSALNQQSKVVNRSISTEISAKPKDQKLAVVLPPEKAPVKKLATAKPVENVLFCSTSPAIFFNSVSSSKLGITSTVREWNSKNFSVVVENKSKILPVFTIKSESLVHCTHLILSKYSTDFSVRPPPSLI